MASVLENPIYVPNSKIPFVVFDTLPYTFDGYATDLLAEIKTTIVSTRPTTPPGS